MGAEAWNQGHRHLQVSGSPGLDFVVAMVSLTHGGVGMLRAACLWLPMAPWSRSSAGSIEVTIMRWAHDGRSRVLRLQVVGMLQSAGPPTTTATTLRSLHLKFIVTRTFKLSSCSNNTTTPPPLSRTELEHSLGTTCCSLCSLYLQSQSWPLSSWRSYRRRKAGWWCSGCQCS